VIWWRFTRSVMIRVDGRTVALFWNRMNAATAIPVPAVFLGNRSSASVRSASAFGLRPAHQPGLTLRLSIVSP
jgi:hypothetical protein